IDMQTNRQGLRIMGLGEAAAAATDEGCPNGLLRSIWDTQCEYRTQEQTTCQPIRRPGHNSKRHGGGDGPHDCVRPVPSHAADVEGRVLDEVISERLPIPWPERVVKSHEDP